MPLAKARCVPVAQRENGEFVVGEMASQPRPPAPVRAVPPAPHVGAQVFPIVDSTEQTEGARERNGGQYRVVVRWQRTCLTASSIWAASIFSPSAVEQPPLPAFAAGRHSAEPHWTSPSCDSVWGMKDRSFTGIALVVEHIQKKRIEATMRTVRGRGMLRGSVFICGENRGAEEEGDVGQTKHREVSGSGPLHGHQEGECANRGRGCGTRAGGGEEGLGGACGGASKARGRVNPHCVVDVFLGTCLVVDKK